MRARPAEEPQATTTSSVLPATGATGRGRPLAWASACTRSRTNSSTGRSSPTRRAVRHATSRTRASSSVESSTSPSPTTTAVWKRRKVPSTRGASFPHCARQSTRSPLTTRCRESRPSTRSGDRLPELNLWTTPGESKRVYQPERFHLAHTPDADHARHVLLIEDTWVTGSNARSAAGALFREGIEKVSILTIARLVDSGYTPARPLVNRIRDLANTPKLMWACPWTRSGNCPTNR